MNSKFLSAFTLQDTESIKDLLSGHTVLGITRIIHNIIGNLKQSTRIVSTADNLRNMTKSLLQTVNMSNIIQINNGTKLIRICKFFCRGVIR